jgi:hypothetical protein
MAIGTSLDANVKILKEITDQIKQVRGVEFVNPFISGELTGHSHTYIRLVDISARNFTQEDVAKDIRKIMARSPNIRSRVNWPSALGEGESYSGINVRILGPDLIKVGEYAKKIYDAGLVPDESTGTTANSRLLSERISIRMYRLMRLPKECGER